MILWIFSRSSLGHSNLHMSSGRNKIMPRAIIIIKLLISSFCDGPESEVSAELWCYWKSGAATLMKKREFNYFPGRKEWTWESKFMASSSTFPCHFDSHEWLSLVVDMRMETLKNAIMTFSFSSLILWCFFIFGNEMSIRRRWKHLSGSGKLIFSCAISKNYRNYFMLDYDDDDDVQNCWEFLIKKWLGNISISKCLLITIQEIHFQMKWNFLCNETFSIHVTMWWRRWRRMRNENETWK